MGGRCAFSYRMAESILTIPSIRPSSAVVFLSMHSIYTVTPRCDRMFSEVSYLAHCITSGGEGYMQHAATFRIYDFHKLPLRSLGSDIPVV